MIRIGIYGYGNLGKGIEAAVRQNKDMVLVGIFTNRDPSTVKCQTDKVKVYHASEALNMTNEIDVMMMCGGSRTDLPVQTPLMAKYFNVVDSFDTHADINKHFDKVNESAVLSKKVSVISVGWDPGMFSLNRLYSECILPDSSNYTFWGKGVSQGHSDAIRRVNGVLDARQYTIPIDKALNAVRNGQNPSLSTREKHLRECFVVPKENADLKQIENDIKTMPNYFADYDTIVHFVTLEELLKEHGGIPHGGFVIQSGVTGFNLENKHVIEYSLKLDSNPEFTSSVMIAYGRAAYRLSKEGFSGAKTVFDIAPRYLSNKSDEELRKNYL